MKVEAFDGNYQIRNYRMRRESGEHVLEWNYRKGTHFFVIIHDAWKELDIGDIAAEMEEAGITDFSIPGIKGNRLYDTRDGKASIFLFREEYVRRERLCRIRENEIAQRIPYGISVFAGEYDSEEEMMHLYPSEGSEGNTEYEPVRVLLEMKYRSWPWLKNKLCYLKLPQIDCYEDGSLRYFLSSSKVPYPLPAACMGRKLCISIPKESSVYVESSEKCKNYYKLWG